MTTTESNILEVFRDLCKANGAASPADVLVALYDRGQLSQLDTVIDIADKMKEMRNRGLL